jgi:hypothetical protein
MKFSRGDNNIYYKFDKYFINTIARLKIHLW